MNLPIDAGLELEAGYCAKLIVGKVCKNLIHIFKLSESLKKNIKGGETTRVNKAGVLGGGTMGGGIAGLLAGQEITTRLFDVAAPALNHALKSFSDNLNRRVKQKQITKARAQQLLEKLHTTSTLNGFGNVDILIEAVVEKMEVKKQLFANLEGQLKDAAIIATNTSSLSVTEMATVLKQPQRLVGMHFFNPVHKMPLVEIIAGKQSDVKSLQSVYALALRLKKFPVIVKDSPGFLVNRLLGFYLNEAMFMLLEGAELESIDAALIDFGMPMGPFRLMDVVGLDIIEKAQSHLTAGLGLTAAGGQPRLPLSPLLQKVRDQNLLGEKNQQGFYLCPYEPQRAH
jgi:3-hydroxyacyl-CoA dehydrogenase/enoyl-CoA hydratase/3-hydroxybutyryl-CoA epimerase